VTPLPLVRTGTCQPEQCGSACCQALNLEINPAYRADADVAQWIGLHGITMFERDGRTFARIPTPCQALTAHGWCGIYGQPERPALCGAFPSAPASLDGVEAVCTFSFRPERTLH
jgi:hypothetical protein